ncbi:MAG TPA: hypothetical protein DIU37_04205 [Opitutae bacterium]|nr:hypothetical protein [Opitutae bacterium]|tara:strand:+ start:145 stop:1128 length:984 start_codon:yes stop_codon:yes gene_type:complete
MSKVTKPLRYGVILAGVYFFLAGLYVSLSTHLVSEYAPSLEAIRYFELIKGFGFVFFTAILLFWLSYSLFCRIENDGQRLLKQKEVLAEAGRRATAGVFASSVAHDSSNVLVSLRFCLELLERNQALVGANHELVETMKKAINELSGLNRRLLDSSQQGLSGDFEERDLVKEIKGTLALARANLRVKHCDLSFQGDDTLVLMMNPLLVSEMVLNLVLNAGDATQGSGRVIVKAERRGEYACLEVHDNGPGIPQEERERIFDAFFTTKEGGSGLGLLTVKACAELHGGQLQVSNSPIGGACFTIWIPLDAVEKSKWTHVVSTMQSLFF